MPNYAKAIPPEKLASSGNRELYNKIAEFLPFYLNYNKIAPAVTAGDFSNLSAIDALDVVPAGKVGALAGKLAPALGMVINPKTLDKFIKASREAAERLKTSEFIKFANEVPEELRARYIEAAGRIATRYPRLFSKLNSINVGPSESRAWASYLPTTKEISIATHAPLEELDNIFAHEITHHGQKVYASPTKMIEYLPGARSGNYIDEDIPDYVLQPSEIEAFVRGQRVGELLNKIRLAGTAENALATIPKSELKGYKITKEYNEDVSLPYLLLYKLAEKLNMSRAQRAALGSEPLVPYNVFLSGVLGVKSKKSFREQHADSAAELLKEFIELTR